MIVVDFEASWTPDLTEAIDALSRGIQHVLVGEDPGWHVSKRVMASSAIGPTRGRIVREKDAAEIATALPDLLEQASAARASMQFRDRFPADPRGGDELGRSSRGPGRGACGPRPR